MGRDGQREREREGNSRNGKGELFRHGRLEGDCPSYSDSGFTQGWGL